MKQSSQRTTENGSCILQLLHCIFGIRYLGSYEYCECWTGYEVEKCEDGTDLWESVGPATAKESQVVKGLTPGKKYKFRVRAINKLGPGEPKETNQAILAKNPFGENSDFFVILVANTIRYCVTNFKIPLFSNSFAILFFVELDPPGEPKDVEIPKYDRSSVTLKWKAPNDDGGNPITGEFIFEFNLFLW